MSMAHLRLAFAVGVIWGLALGWPLHAADPEPPKKAQTAPATQPAVPIHPILTQTSFVVDPGQVSGNNDLSKRLGPITVTLNYYDQLPGLDLDKLSPERRKRVIERANKESCTCGCRGDTVARCLVNDPACKLVKALARQIYEEERLRPEASH